MARLSAVMTASVLLASACVGGEPQASASDPGSADVEPDTAEPDGTVTEEEAIRLAGDEGERRGIALEELRPEAVRVGDHWQVEFFPVASGQRGGGYRVTLSAENGEVVEVSPWR